MAQGRGLGLGLNMRPADVHAKRGHPSPAAKLPKPLPYRRGRCPRLLPSDAPRRCSRWQGGMRALALAAWHGHMDAMAALLDAGADVNGADTVRVQLTD